MKRLTLAIIAVALLGLGALAAACSEESGLSLEEYFQRVDAVFADRDERVQALQDRGDFPESQSEEEIAGYLRQSFEGLASIASDFHSDLDQLEPPAEAEDAHNELVAAVEPIPALFEGVAGQVPTTLTREASEQYDPFPGGEGTEPLMRLDEACAALQTIADDNQITIDLACEEEG